MPARLQLLVMLAQTPGMDSIDVVYGFLTGALGAILFGGTGLRSALGNELPKWHQILQDRYGRDFANRFWPSVVRSARLWDWSLFVILTGFALWGYFGYRYFQLQNDKDSAFGMELLASLACISLFLLPWFERRVLLSLKLDIYSGWIHLRTWQ